MSLGAVEVAVPDTQKTTDGRNVILQCGRTEVLVHLMGTCQELLEVLKANVQSDGQTDGAPYRVTTTNPALKAEHVLAVNTELGNLRLVGRQSNEVLRNVAFAISLFEEPALGGVGVGGSFGGGKSLGGNQEESCLGVGVGESFRHVGAVDVRDEVEGHVLGTVVLQSLGHHDGTPVHRDQSRLATILWFLDHLQVGTTNADVDDGRQLLAGESLPLAAANLLAELLHMGQDLIDTATGAHDINAIDLHLPRLAL